MILGFYGGRARLAGILLVSLVMLAQCAGTTGVVGAKIPPVIDPGVRAAAGSGQARVIVVLRIVSTWKPEGDLPGRAGEDTQRKAIAQAQAEVLARLGGTRFTVTRQYDSLPMIALEIGADALVRLESAGDVVAHVLPDRRLVPQQ